MALELRLVSDLDAVQPTAEASLPRARLHALDRERIVLVSSRPAPPGAPLVLHLAGRTLEARTRSCKQSGSAAEYVLVARLVNLSKVLRVELEQLMNRSRPPDSRQAKGPRDH